MALSLFDSIVNAEKPRAELLSTARKIEKDGIKTIDGYRVFAKTNPEGDAYFAVMDKHKILRAVSTFSMETYSELNISITKSLKTKAKPKKEAKADARRK